MIRKVNILSHWPHIRGWFTQKSEKQINPDGVLPGFNFGYHTCAPEKEVTANRRLLCNELGVDPAALVTARQIHSANVEIVNRGGVFSDTDGLVTDKPGLTLGIQVADCAAVLLADPERRVIGAAHAGWRGAAQQIVPETIQTMKNQSGAVPSGMRAYISPSISQTYFEVGEEVAELFDESYLDRSRGERPYLDLKSVILDQLIESGVPKAQISVDPDCTWSQDDLYYSWRREGKNAGRMMALIQLLHSPQIEQSDGIVNGTGGIEH